MKQLLTPEAAAEKLAVSVKTVKNLLRSGKLRGVKVGNLWRLQEESLEEYLKASTHYEVRGGIKMKEKYPGKTTEHTPRTPLGQQLWDMRSRLVASGEPLLGWEEIEREIAERRGEVE